MKNLILLLALFTMSFTVVAQSKAPVKPNTTVDVSGNYKERTDELTGKTYTSAEGKVYPVYKSTTGKLYIIKGKSVKTGKPLRKYLIL